MATYRHACAVGVIATIDNASVQAQPGSQASCTVRVRNTGMVVDHLLLDVIGDAAAWAQVQPPELNLLPGADATAQVVFSPPRNSEVPAGPVPFGVRVMSQEDPAGSAIEEGQVEVAAFTGIGAAIAPRTARGRRSALFRLIVENQGNVASRASVSASDPDLLLRFRIRPDILSTEPGTATIVKVRASAKKRFLKGPDRSAPFQTLIQADDCPPLTVDGAMLQQQLMPEWLLPAIGVLCVAAAALVALWFTVLKPEVHAAATSAVAQATKKLNDSAKKANDAAASANKAATGANNAASTANTTTQGITKRFVTKGSTKQQQPASNTPPGSAIAGGTPVSTMLHSTAAVNKPASFVTTQYKVPAKDTLAVTDIVLQNPLGDAGVLQIRVGKKVLFVFGLANFRSIDYHFVQPLDFTSKNPLVLAVECTTPAVGKTCSDAMSFSGGLIKPAPKKAAGHH
jgi:hypothetical protein